MSNERELRSQLLHLSDIGAIMKAMKNLAFMETRKLDRYLQAQTQMVEQIKQSAQIFISHQLAAPAESGLGWQASAHPYPEQPQQELWLLIGSERGFCGDFNQRLAQHSLSQLQQSQRQQSQPQGILTLGQRLNPQPLAGVPPLAQLAGANAAEETQSILISLAQQLSELEQQRGPFRLRVLFNHPDFSQPCSQLLLPPFQELQRQPPRGVRPLLTLAPHKVLLGLGEHYLLVRMQQILQLSLMAENQQRITHLQGAIKKLEQSLQALQRKMNRLRQEAIVEEIEIIISNQQRPDNIPPDYP